jgi:hypothetical protein
MSKGPPPELPQPITPDPYASHRQLVSELKLAFETLEKVETDLGKLDSARATVASEREKLLADSLLNDSEKLIDSLAKANARGEVLDHKRGHLMSELEKAQGELQLLTVESGSRFGTLWRIYRGFLLSQAASKISELLDPEFAPLQAANIEVLTPFARDVVRAENEVRIELSPECSNPLHDSPIRSWSEEVPATMQIVRQWALVVLKRGPVLLARVAEARLELSLPQPAGQQEAA